MTRGKKERKKYEDKVNVRFSSSLLKQFSPRTESLFTKQTNFEI